MRRQRLSPSTLLTLAACAALAASCGGSSSSNAECSDHDDCGADEICAPDSKTCVQNTCGDGVVRGDEACDDGADNSDTQPDACRTDCTAPACGDGVTDTGEQCDEGADNGGSPEPCRADCTLTTCGDGYLGGDEACDGTDLAGATCEDEAGLADGTPACTAACSLDPSPCHTCGNGTLEGPERCDLANLDGRTCAGLGYGGGSLSCSDDCLSLDESWCFTCGDGLCEHEKGETTSACPADCGWVQIASGGNTTCGRKADRSAWCWGSNDTGQLGNGTLDSTSLPQRVAYLDDVVKLSDISGHVCALRADQSVWCWGWNNKGQLGNGSALNATAPVQSWFDLPATDVVATIWLTCAVVEDAGQTRALCVGWNHGLWGNGSTTDSMEPVLVDHGLDRLSMFADHGCGLHPSTNLAYCWQNNDYGELGDGSTTNSASTPVLVNPPDGFTAQMISTGVSFTCAIGTDGAAYCWGKNNVGQVGDNTQVERHLPTPVQGTSGTIVDLSAGSWGACAVNSLGQVFCWGYNYHGEAGDGTHVVKPGAVQVPSLSGVTQVDCRGYSCCAIDDAGKAWCWGSNDHGQAGLGFSSDEVLVPSAVVDPYE